MIQYQGCTRQDQNHYSRNCKNFIYSLYAPPKSYQYCNHQYNKQNYYYHLNEGYSKHSLTHLHY
jgi:hypothetical protein